MSIETLSFSNRADGWNSFHSFKPEMMIGMNSSLYTFKDGSLYKHNTNTAYNRYYGTDYDTTIKTVFNEGPGEDKMFKTLLLDSTTTWQADLSTEFTDGIVETNYWTKKEGQYYSFIRRDPGVIDNTMMSTQGIGTLLLWDTPTLTGTFGFNLATNISIGDKLYTSDSAASPSTLVLIGTVTAHTTTTITVDAEAVTPLATDKIAFVKDSTAESYGARGSELVVELTNSETTSVEVFTVGTDVHKSNP
jgi:hypothetical protein